MAERPTVWVDEGLPIAAASLDPSCLLRRFSGRELSADSPGLEAVEGLVVRSISAVSAELFARASRLRVVASATIGLDHVDRVAAARHSVAVAHAPGCNAPGVADWVLWALLTDAAERGLPVAGRRLGIVGVGHTGSAVAARAERLGYVLLPNDPPRAAREPDFAGVPLAEALVAEAVTLHVPLSVPAEGAWPTVDLVDAARLRPGTLLLNAARGAVLRGDLGATRYAFDTWRGEPRPDAATVAAAWRATPHIAGATAEGKHRAQSEAARAVLRAIGLPLGRAVPLSPPSLRATLSASRDRDPEAEAIRACAAVLDVATGLTTEDRRFRQESARDLSFDAQRDAHRRHELGALTLSWEGEPSSRTQAMLSTLGPQVVPAGDANLHIVFP